MRRTIPAAVAALAGALTLAACTGGPAFPGQSSSSPGRAAPTFSPAVTISPSAFPTAAPAATSLPARVTISQAGTAYLHIAAPVNRAAAAVNTDLAYGVPFALTRADDLAYIAALRKSRMQLRAIRWPAQVQGYVAAMVLTYPASLACAQAVASAGSNSAATAALSTNQACARSQYASDPHEIRLLLHLPSTAGYLPGI